MIIFEIKILIPILQIRSGSSGILSGIDIANKWQSQCLFSVYTSFLLNPKSRINFFFFFACLVTQSCPILCDPMDCSLPDSSVHGSFQARVLEWVDSSYSSRSSQPNDPTGSPCISCIDRQILYLCASWEALTLSLALSATVGEQD